MNLLEQVLAARAAVPQFPPPAAPVPGYSALSQVLARTGLTQEQLTAAISAESTKAPAKRPAAVMKSGELIRIGTLPRRPRPGAEELAQLAQAYTAGLRSIRGEQTLWPLQAWALHELRQCGGAFVAANVGAGKTLIAWLALTVTGARRPLVIVPAKLKEKTRKDFRRYAAHWAGPSPDAVRIESYEFISHSGGVDVDDHKGNPGFLQTFAPDLIVADEIHKLRRKTSARLKRFKRHMKASPGTKFVALSGTVTNRSLHEYAHILEWCLPNGCPLPTIWEDYGKEFGRQDTLDLWASALDEKVAEGKRIAPGALLELASPEQQREARYGGAYEIKAARQGYRSRLIETPGVVATQEARLTRADGTLVALTLREWAPAARDPALEPHFRQLRTMGETPAGLLLADSISVWACARQLGLGFFYKWDPAAPEDWYAKRKAWASLCREILKVNKRGLDTEKDVAKAVLKDLYPGREILEDWRAIRPTFEPKNVATWLSYEALEAAARWALEGPGLIWTAHVEFALELQRWTGLAYYGRGGLDAAGKPVESHDPRYPAIVSILGNQEGRNLQAFNRNLVMCPPSTGMESEQLLGREHRSGQERDVTADFWFGCQEHAGAFWQAVQDSEYVLDSTGAEYKLITATNEVPELDEVEARGGFRWRK